MTLATQTEEAIVKVLADELELDMIWARFDKTTLQQEARFKPVIRQQFNAQEAEVLSNVGRSIPLDMITDQTPTQIMNNWLFDETAWGALLERAAKPFIDTSMVEGAIEGIRGINAGLGIDLALSFNVNDPNVVQIANDKLLKFSFEVNQETTRLLKKEFREAIAAGDTLRNVEKRVEKVFGFNDKVRTNRIVRTEILGYHNAGTFEAMVQSGVVETKQWINSRDARVRESHRITEVVPLMDRFSTGLRFPGDWTGEASEVINCRCVMRAKSFVI